jgi:hypothetical protein
MHQSCVKISTISKWTKTCFHSSHVTLEYHRVRPNQFLILRYLWHKPCTYHASKWALSPNRPKQASTWASPPRSTVGCVQNDFWANGKLGANRAPKTDSNTISEQTDARFHITHVTYEFHQVCPKWYPSPMAHSAQTMHLSCVKISTISKRMETSLNLGVSEMISKHNGTFGTNRALILRQD